MITKDFPQIGEVYLVNLKGEGSVQVGLRPAVVFQNNIGNKHSPNVVVLPLTTSLKRLEMPTHILVSAEDSGLARDSMVLCENPQCVPKDQLGRYLTTLPEHYMARIAAGSIMASGAISYMDLKTVVNLWQQANVLNEAS